MFALLSCKIENMNQAMTFSEVSREIKLSTCECKCSAVVELTTLSVRNRSEKGFLLHVHIDQWFVTDIQHGVNAMRCSVKQKDIWWSDLIFFSD